MRLAVAGQRVVDEDTAAMVFDRREGSLSDRHRAALRLADALMTMPSSLTDDTLADLRAHFSRDELVELTVDVMKWNYQKVMVALDADPEVIPGQVADLLFDEQGNWVRPT